MLPNRVELVGFSIALNIAIITVVDAFISAIIREEFLLINY